MAPLGDAKGFAALAQANAKLDCAAAAQTRSKPTYIFGTRLERPHLHFTQFQKGLTMTQATRLPHS
jgi:hypothetical protein